MMTVDELLDAVVIRLGGADALRRIQASEVRGSVTFADLSGTFYSVVENATASYRYDVDLRVMRQNSGGNGAMLWYQDSNGKIHTTSDEEILAETRVHAGFDNDRYLLERAEYDYSLNDGENEFVLTVTDREFADKPFATTQLFIDRTELLIARRDVMKEGQRSTSYFEDYRDTDGVLSAWQVRNIDAAGNETITLNEQLIYNPEIDLSLFDPPADEVRDYTFMHGGEFATIPLRIPIEHIYTNVVINGRTFEFNDETGASKTLIATDLAEELERVKVASIQGQGISGIHEAMYVTVPELIVGEVKMMEQQVLAMDLTLLRKKIPGLAGLVGMDFLNRFVIRFDYVQSEMTVYDRESFSYEGDGELFALHDIECAASFDGHVGKHSLDTGAGEYSLHAPFVRRHALVRDPDAMPRISTISGIGSVELVSYEALCHEFRIGQFVFHDVPCFMSEIETGAFANEMIIGNIGGIILRKFISYFDFTANTMILEPNVNFNEPSPIHKLGVGFKLEDERIVVDSVATNTPAAAAGIERGEELLEFDGKPAADYTLDDLRLLARAPEGTKYHLRFSTSSGEERGIEIVLRNYLRHYDDY
jgi:hypothetical protein